MGNSLKARLKDLATAWLPGFEPEDTVVATALPAMEVAAEPTIVLEQVSAANEAATDLPIQDILVAPLLQTETEQESQATPEPRIWPAFVDAMMASATGVIERIAQNLGVIRTLQAIQAAGAEVTQEIRHELLRFSGWGGLARMFGPTQGNSLEPQRAELEALLPPKAYASARSGVLTAYYTHPEVIQAMWSMVRRLGFSGGRVVEPAAGSGRFIACMPADMAQHSEITVVEADELSAQLLEATFSGLGVQVLHSEVEKANLPNGFFDLAITNVPFGEFKSNETRKVPYAEFSLHNYFIAKAIDLVRPGGLVAVITSSYTMDAERLAHRQWINAQAELVMALRLPSDAFAHSGTEVVSDILLFQRRAAPAFAAHNPWLDIEPSTTVVTRGHVCINHYYNRHPQHVLGQLVEGRGMYGQTVLNVKAQGGVSAMLQALRDMVQVLPEGRYKPEVREDEALLPSLVTVRATHGVKPGAYVVHNGRIHLSQDSLNWLDVDDAYKGKLRERVLALIGMRDKVRQLIELQLNTDDDQALRPLQTELTIKYDRFLSEFGYINDQANVRAFRSDPDCPLLLSLESYDERTEKYRKAAIFSRRTAGKVEPPSRVESVKDAMLIALGLYGRIQLQDMAMRLGTTRAAVKQQLQEQQLAFNDPADHQWKPADEYLSGMIRDKIAVASTAGARYARNVVALQAVLPKDLGPKDVDIRLGSTWVPTDVVADFAAHLLKLSQPEREKLSVAFNPDDTSWSFLYDGRPFSGNWLGDHGERVRTWGTNKRDAWEIMLSALNQQPPKVTYTVDGKTYVDQVATMAAREKYEAVKAKFREWAYADADRQERLLRIYNDTFNQVVERCFDGSHLTLPGVSKVIEPYKHQLDAIWRIVTTGNTLLAHVVGAGKSFTMIAAAMELRRLGKARKPVIVVANHLLYQFVGECMQFYPTAQILMATKEDFEADKRQQFAARVAVGDWDCVVMTASCFEKLPLRPEAQQDFIDEVLASIEAMARLAADRSGSRGVKALEKKLKTIRSKLEKGADTKAKDDLVTFEDLGIDWIMYDEAHALKNLMRISKMPNIAGLPNAASRRALDAWMKFEYIMQKHDGHERGICLATGTPVTNSVPV